MAYMLILKKSTISQNAVKSLQTQNTNHSICELDGSCDKQHNPVVTKIVNNTIIDGFTPVLVDFEDYIPKNTKCIMADMNEVLNLLQNSKYRIISNEAKIKLILSKNHQHLNLRNKLA